MHACVDIGGSFRISSDEVKSESVRVRLHVLRVCVLQQVIDGRGRPRKTEAELYADAAKMV